MSDWVHLEELVVSCRVGLYPGEQDREQPIEVGVHLGLDLERAASGDLAESVDYAQVLAQVEFIARHGHWGMLESLAVSLARWFLLPLAAGEERAPLNEVRVQLRKPQALAGRALPSVEVSRARERVNIVAHELAPGVQLERICETQEIGVYRLALLPAISWRPSFRAGTHWAWMSIVGTAKVAGAELGCGAVRVGAAAELFPLIETQLEPLVGLVLSDKPLELT